jgi:hypothetical protein
MLCRKTSPWQHNLNQKASGKPGAVQGASERTVKHWFAGTHGPSGQHLVALASHSDAVFTRFLQAANRHSSLVGLELVSIRSKALELVEIIDGIGTFDALIKRET